MRRPQIVCSPSVCERLSELVAEARLNYPAISDRLHEPGFQGSLEEADLVHAYIDSVQPEFAHAFVDWRRKRLATGNALPGGVDMRTRHRTLVLAPNGLVSVRS